MRKSAIAVIAIALTYLPGSWAKGTSQQPSQTARQALSEMFFGKEAGTFLNHLPAVTRATLEQSGALTNIQQYTALAGQMQAQSKNFQTFEAGPIMFTSEDPKTGQKVDMFIENDDLHGDQDDIEVSFHSYKDGQVKRTPFMPHLIFSMKTESGVWKLFEISVTIHVPLADPDLLKTVSDGIKAHAAAPTFTTMHAQPAAHTFTNDSSTVSAMRTITTAEITYAATYPAVGFTCTLSDLDGFGGGEANEHQAMLINSGLASGKWRGYSFTLSQCNGAPANKFQLTAVPIGEAYGRRAFCADQSGVIRSSADGTAASCLGSGSPAQ